MTSAASVRMPWLCAGLVAAVLALPPQAARAQSAAELSAIENPRTAHSGWVSDPEGVLAADKSAVEARLSALNAQTGAEVAVVIAPSIGEHVPRTFATKLFEHWKIGRKGHDDGVLVLHVLDQRRVEIETGYGVEGALPDAKCAWLISEVALPDFKEGKLARGMVGLVAGVEHALRHPEAGHDALVQAGRAAAEQAKTQAPSALPAGKTAQAKNGELDITGVLERMAQNADAPLLLSLLLAFFARYFRVRAHRSLHRLEMKKKRKPELAAAGYAVSLLTCGALCVTAAVMREPAVQYVGTLGFLLVALVTALSARSDFAAARKRFAPRVCPSCGQSMQLVRDGKDLKYLEPGKQSEERIRSVNYDVWRCEAGHVSVEEQSRTDKADPCAACGYLTEQLKGTSVLQAPTVEATGSAVHHYECAHCKAQRTERVELPRKERPRPASSSSYGSSGRSSSGSSGSSFGGGRSGGGGAGGSY